MRKTRHRFHFSPLIAVVVVMVGLFQSANAFGDDSIVLPNPRMLGKPVGSVSPLIVSNRDTVSVFPENIHLDLNGPEIYGVMATYPESVTFQDLVDAVDRKHKKWTRDPDGKMAKFGVAVWRNEDDRYAIQVADSQVIMIWLDREITQREVNGVAMELFKDAVKRSLKDREGTTSTEME
jgi:hypothetical protein